ncbi:MAG: RNA polymerase sigma factor [Deltaproteobacteria bacterium]|nr:RNA polymerase sigma factor [Deltaproteobacteria bacterium]
MGEPWTSASAIEAVWRVEAPRLIGGLIRFVRDVDRAEDLAQDALLVALERWPSTGIPNNPGAWLMTTAKNRAVDQSRRQVMIERKHDALKDQAEALAPAFEPADPFQDDVLRLILIACHPLLSREARVALTLRLVAGLSTLEIARAFLSTEATVAQRIVRAKRTIAEAKVPFEVPSGPELEARIGSTLEVLYLVFNEGYAASAGEDWIRPELCEEAMRLGRILVGLLPDQAEVHGLLALMELHAARIPARTHSNGDIVLLLDQDRARWDRLLMERGLAALSRAEALAQPLGPYTLQAAIAACHVRARTPEATDWPRIVALYDGLVELTGSPIVELNRAMAVAMAHGPAEALPLVEALTALEVLDGYAPLHAARGDLLYRLDRREEARRALERAAALTQNAKERSALLAKVAACVDPTGPRH